MRQKDSIPGLWLSYGGSKLSVSVGFKLELSHFKDDYGLSMMRAESAEKARRQRV